MRFFTLTVIFCILLILAACQPGSSSPSPAVETAVPQLNPEKDDLSGSDELDAAASPSAQDVEEKLEETASAEAAADEAAPTAELIEEAESMSGSPNADVEFVRAVLADDGSWSFNVTISHPDTGWEDYADGWDVLLPGGRVLKKSPDDPFTRLLLHPHVDEQPFTRSQSGLKIPEGTETVIVRAHDLIDGFGGQEVIVNLSLASGENFSVERP